MIITITYIDSSSFWKVPKRFCKLQIKELLAAACGKTIVRTDFSIPIMSFLHFLQHLFSPFFSFFLLTENFGIEALRV